MNNLLIHNEEKDFIESLKQIVHSARKMAYASVNYAQVASNWLIGRRIVEEEQAGEVRAKYGKHVIELASKALTEEFGKGFSETNIRSFRKFYIEFQHLAIQQAVSAKLSWSHYERSQTYLIPQFGITLPHFQVQDI